MNDISINNNGIRLGIVIPLANEEKTISCLLDKVLKQINEADIVFCVLDNVSKDNTKKIIEEYSMQDNRVHLIWAPENRCIVDAYIRGYKEALYRNCKWILEMDGGLSHNPEEIHRFIANMSKGYDFAAGSRFITGSNYKGFSYRYIISRGGTLLANIILKTKMKDMTSGFECFTHNALSYVLKKGIKSRAHFFQTEIRALLRDWNWVEVPISYSNPSARLKKESIFEAFRNLRQLSKEMKTKQEEI